MCRVLQKCILGFVQPLRFKPNLLLFPVKEHFNVHINPLCTCVFCTIPSNGKTKLNFKEVNEVAPSSECDYN